VKIPLLLKEFAHRNREEYRKSLNYDPVSAVAENLQ